MSGISLLKGNEKEGVGFATVTRKREEKLWAAIIPKREDNRHFRVSSIT